MTEKAQDQAPVALVQVQTIWAAGKEFTDMDAALRHQDQMLVAPFLSYYVKWRAMRVSRDKKRALAAAYIDSRAVMDRLDYVFGKRGWSPHYTVTPKGLMCDLTVTWADGTVTTKSALGHAGGGIDIGEKGDESDALKRAAVVYGVGRYLYRMPSPWVDYDDRAKRLTRLPPLPDWADPKGDPTADGAPPVGYAPEPEPDTTEAPKPEPQTRQPARQTRQPRTPGESQPAAGQEILTAGSKTGEPLATPIQDLAICKVTDERPLPGNWKLFYEMALGGKYGEYDAQPHVVNAVRQYFPGFNRRGKNRQNVSIHQAWSVILFRTLTETQQATVMASASQSIQKGVPQEPEQDDLDETKGKPEQQAKAGGDAHWADQEHPDNQLVSWFQVLGLMDLSPAVAVHDGLGTATLLDYSGTFDQAITALMEKWPEKAKAMEKKLAAQSQN